LLTDSSPEDGHGHGGGLGQMASEQGGRAADGVADGEEGGGAEDEDGHPEGATYPSSYTK
jgi:hypothetical protein